MSENEEGLELEDGAQEDDVDAELKAEFDKLEAEGAKYGEDGELVEAEEVVEAIDDAEGDDKKLDVKPEEKKGDEVPTDEEAIQIATKYLTARGMKVVLPGEEEAVKAGATQEAKQQTAEEILAGLPDVPLDPNVIALIDQKYASDPVQRDAAFVRYATSVSNKMQAEEIAKNAVAPLMQQQAQAQWQALAVATARDIATKAEVPEAEQKIAEIIMKAGPDSQQKYASDPFYKQMMDATIKMAVLEVRDSLADTEQRPMPKAERVGGAKAGGDPYETTLTGEDKSVAEGIRRDVKEGKLTKKEGDEMLKSMLGAKK